jgi:hypothetical protein
MKKLSIKSIVEFRGKSERAKKNFANSLKLDKPEVESGSGGDYWVSCLSAISNGYKFNDLNFIIEKMEDLEDKHKENGNSGTKTMYRRNITILSHYESFDFRKWWPSKKTQLLRKHKSDSVLTIKDFQLQVKPQHVFTFPVNNENEIGAIWFIAKLDGFRKDELGMFCDILYRYLKTHFSKKYRLSPKYCIAVDVFNTLEVRYSQLEKREIPMILDSTLDEIKKLMQ